MCLAAWGRARAEQQRLDDLARLPHVPDLSLVAAGATGPMRDHEVDGGRHGEHATAGA
ncbi:hypothetical protein MILUP08_44340 [Micromonospora lupini str. Lupac 08]|uniref:Uncharacterized protein n=1 Tax=Micromonospora lupini str. Lupac 08 TaxID=1150864 RepID=I0L6L8_9ACTN|nr:hypothetical protein MILUP08_44340 [Micromonospora lupini str. Lupac 08]